MGMAQPSFLSLTLCQACRWLLPPSREKLPTASVRKDRRVQPADHSSGPHSKYQAGDGKDGRGQEHSRELGTARAKGDVGEQGMTFTAALREAGSARPNLLRF